jgi:hypothetical protein
VGVDGYASLSSSAVHPLSLAAHELDPEGRNTELAVKLSYGLPILSLKDDSQTVASFASV